MSRSLIGRRKRLQSSPYEYYAASATSAPTSPAARASSSSGTRSRPSPSIVSPVSGPEAPRRQRLSGRRASVKSRGSIASPFPQGPKRKTSTFRKTSASTASAFKRASALSFAVKSALKRPALLRTQRAGRPVVKQLSVKAAASRQHATQRKTPSPPKTVPTKTTTPARPSSTNPQPGGKAKQRAGPSKGAASKSPGGAQAAPGFAYAAPAITGNQKAGNKLQGKQTVYAGPSTEKRVSPTAKPNAGKQPAKKSPVPSKGAASSHNDAQKCNPQYQHIAVRGDGRCSIYAVMVACGIKLGGCEDGLNCYRHLNVVQNLLKIPNVQTLNINPGMYMKCESSPMHYVYRTPSLQRIIAQKYDYIIEILLPKNFSIKNDYMRGKPMEFIHLHTLKGSVFKLYSPDEVRSMILISLFGNEDSLNNKEFKRLEGLFYNTKIDSLSHPDLKPYIKYGTFASDPDDVDKKWCEGRVLAFINQSDHYHVIAHKNHYQK